MFAKTTSLGYGRLRSQLAVSHTLNVPQSHPKLAVCVHARQRRPKGAVGDADPNEDIPPVVEAQSTEPDGNTVKSTRHTRGPRAARGGRRSAARGKANGTPAVGLEVLEKLEVVKTDEDG